MLLTALFAVVVAWFVDHRKLKEQIKPIERRTVAIYGLSNASPDHVVAELTRLYPKQKFTTDAAGRYDETTEGVKVIVAASTSLYEQIGAIIQTLDR